MKMLTLVARLPKYRNEWLVKKVWRIATYLKDEVGIRVHLVIHECDEEPHLIVMNDKISLRSDISEIIDRIADKLTYDIADDKFLDKVAASTLISN